MVRTCMEIAFYSFMSTSLQPCVFLRWKLCEMSDDCHHFEHTLCFMVGCFVVPDGFHCPPISFCQQCMLKLHSTADLLTCLFIFPIAFSLNAAHSAHWGQQQLWAGHIGLLSNTPETQSLKPRLVICDRRQWSYTKDQTCMLLFNV